MIILDTNVISACMRPDKNKPVMEWLKQQPPRQIWTTTISIFELRYGIEGPIDDDFRAELELAWQEFGTVIFENRILPLDMEAANAAAVLAGKRRSRKRDVGIRDTFIAGIAISKQATLATRNIKDFKDASLELIDPWKAGKDLAKAKPASERKQ
ncbi:MAG: type II toxin-antitoxin system VapC family toxin [Hyphomicrobiales bacterium]|nr:type II toxin-antitoxin system VapC family toxin [Hyphomicrobiales bacterium]